MQKTSIAVIGGAGKAGKYIVQELLKQGYSLKLLLRHPSDPGTYDPKIRVIQGDARDPAAIGTLLEDCSALVSAVGQPKGEPSVFSAVSRHIVETMEKYQTEKYILLTGVNVDTPQDQKSGYAKMATEWMKKNYPNTTADKQVEWEELSRSSIDRTMIRLPMIQMTDTITEFGISLSDCEGEQISAGSLALFVSQLLKENAYQQQAPFIFNR